MAVGEADYRAIHGLAACRLMLVKTGRREEPRFHNTPGLSGPTEGCDKAWAYLVFADVGNRLGSFMKVPWVYLATECGCSAERFADLITDVRLNGRSVSLAPAECKAKSVPA